MDKGNVFNTALAFDGTCVVFPICVGGREIRCSITRNALEQFFWLTPDADDVRVLKAFADGSDRITALAVRRALRIKNGSLKLTASDFER
jgi:hypothetical protein